MTLITTLILTMSTLKILRIVRNSLTYQKSSIGNSICRSKVSNRNGLTSPSQQFLLVIYVLSPSSRPSACCQHFCCCCSTTTVHVKGKKRPPNLYGFYRGLYIVPGQSRICATLCRHKQDILGWLGIRAELAPGTFLWLSQERIPLQCRRPGLNPWVGKIPWRREQLPTPVFWPGESHGLYSPYSVTESDMTE